MTELILGAVVVGLIATVIVLARKLALQSERRRRLEEHNAELMRMVEELSGPRPTGSAIADGFDQLSDDPDAA